MLAADEVKVLMENVRNPRPMLLDNLEAFWKHASTFGSFGTTPLTSRDGIIRPRHVANQRNSLIRPHDDFTAQSRPN
jgi:hypothetical protein